MAAPNPHNHTDRGETESNASKYFKVEHVSQHLVNYSTNWLTECIGM